MATNYSKWANFERELEPDPEDVAREKLRRQKENMSDKEVRRLHDCWEEPEFRRMFEEYQEEVTDPKHRAETEEYLMQCEAEQRAGKQSVRLRPPTQPCPPLLAVCVATKPSRLPARAGTLRSGRPGDRVGRWPGGRGAARGRGRGASARGPSGSGAAQASQGVRAEDVGADAGQEGLRPGEG